MGAAASSWSRDFAVADADRMSIYDEVLVPSLFLPWAEVLLDAVSVEPGDRVLDVATGPGTVAGLAATRAGPAGQVVASDISPAMLEIARGKPVQQGAAPISWIESPAAPLLAGAEGGFDVVTCQQGLQFFPDRPAAIAEMRRMLKPGGRLGLAVWGPQSDSPVFSALGVVVRQMLGDDAADRYEGGPWGMPQPAQLAELLDAAGFTAVTASPHRLTVAFSGGPEQFLRGIAVSPVAADVAGLTPERRAAFAGAVERVVMPMTTGGVLRFETVSNIGLATR